MAREVPRSGSGRSGVDPAGVPPGTAGPPPSRNGAAGGGDAHGDRTEPAEDPADPEDRAGRSEPPEPDEPNGTNRGDAGPGAPATTQRPEDDAEERSTTREDDDPVEGTTEERADGVDGADRADPAKGRAGDPADDDPPGGDAPKPLSRGDRRRGGPRQKTFESLSDRRFRAYFLAMLGSMSSQNMQMVVRAYIAFDLTGSYAALGTISLANAMPGILLAVVGGTLADRVPYRRQVVQVCQGVNALASLAICVFAFTGILNFEQLFVTAIIQGISMAMMMPARQALIPSLVEPHLVTNAVALNAAGMNAMRLFAPALGGFLLAYAGVGWVYFLMTGLWGIASLFMSRVPEPRRDVARIGSIREEMKDGLRNMKEGLVYVWRHPTVGPILGINLLIVIMAMPYQFLLAGFVQDVFSEGADTVGILQSIVGVSSLIGALVIASVRWRRRGMVFLLGSALQGAFLLAAFWLSSSVLMMGVFLFAMGFGQAARQSLSNGLVQSYGDEEYRGRIMSIYMVEFSLAQFGAFITGVLAEALGPRVALGGTSAALVVIALGGLLLLPRLRRLR